MGKDLMVLSSAFISKADLNRYQNQHSDLVGALVNKTAGKDEVNRLNRMALSSDRSTQTLTYLHYARYCEDGGKAQNLALKNIISAVNFSFQTNPKNPQTDNPQYLSERGQFIDCLRDFLPKSNPRFKVLHDIIDSHLIAESSWKSAQKGLPFDFEESPS